MKSLFVLALVMSTSAYAQNKAAPCRADILNFCSGVKGKKNIIACLRQNQAELSSSCSMQFKNAKEALKDCRADMKKLCKESGKGKGDMLKCLKDNSSKLNPACKARIEKQ